MALQARREIRLTIDSTVEGLQDLNKLRAELRSVGLDTTKLDQEMNQLAQTFDELSRQQRLLDQFRNLKRTLADSRQAMLQARQALTQFQQGLSEGTTLTRAQAAEQRRLQQAVQRSERTFRDQATALRGLRQEMNSAGLAAQTLSQNEERIRSSLTQTQQAITRLTGQYRALRTETQKPLGDPTRAFRQGLQQTDAIVSRSAAGIRSLIGLLAGGAVLQGAGRSTLAFEALERGLTAVTGSAEGAQAQLAFLVDAAERLGVSTTQIARPFIQFNAAADAAGVSAQEINRIFNAVVGSITKLGGSTADAEGALRAIGQSFSKGTVQAEELRGQLGERLPGAFQLAAKAMGVTTAELGKMLEQGEVLATDLLPKLATQLEQTFDVGINSRVDGLAASLGRASDATGQFFASIADTGPAQAATAGLDTLADALNRIADSVRELNFTSGLDEAAKSTFELFRALGRSSIEAERFTRLLHDISAGEDALAKRTRELEERYGKLAEELAVAKRGLEGGLGAMRDFFGGTEALNRHIADLEIRLSRVGVELDSFRAAAELGELDDTSKKIRTLQLELDVLGENLLNAGDKAAGLAAALIEGFSVDELGALRNAIAGLVTEADTRQIRIYQTVIEAMDARLAALADGTLPKVARAFEDLVEAPRAFAERVGAELATVLDQAKLVGSELEGVFDKAFSGATLRQSQALVDELIKLTAQGKITGEALDAAMTAYGDRLDAITGKSGDMLDILRRLGIEGAESFAGMSKAGQAAIDDLTDAFEFLEQKGQLTTANVRQAFLSAIPKAETVADLEALREAMDKFAASSTAAASASSSLQGALAKQAQAIKTGAGASTEAAEATDKQIKATDSAAEATEQLTKKERELLDERRENIETTSRLASRSDILTQAIQNARASIAGYGKAAQEAFSKVISGTAGAADETESLFDRLQRVTFEIQRLDFWLNSIAAKYDFFGTAAARNLLAARRIEEQYIRQALAAQNLVDKINRITNATEISTRQQLLLARYAEISVDKFNLLANEDLSTLNAALALAAERTRQLTAEAEQANETVAKLNEQLVSDILALQGDREGVERRRHAQELQRIEALGAADSDRIKEAIKNAEKLHELRLKQIREQQQEQRKTDNVVPFRQDRPLAGGGGVNIEKIELHSAVVDQKTLTDFARQINRELSRLQRFVS